MYNVMSGFCGARLASKGVTLVVQVISQVYIYKFICKLCYKDKLGQTYIYICILSGRKKCDKYAIIFMCKLCYKDKLGQTYLYAYWLEGKM